MDIVAYVIYGVIALFALVTVLSCSFITQQQTRKMLQRLGRFQRVAKPGWSVKLPFIDTVAGEVSLQTKLLPFEEITYTIRGTSVTMKGSISYRVQEDDDSVKKAYYTLQNPDAQIKTHVSSSIRDKVPTMELQDVQQNQSAIAQHVKAQLIETMEKYGYVIDDVLVTNADPDATVIAANNLKYASEMAKETAKNQADAQYARVVRAAQAEAEAMKAHGEGIANERTAIVKGLQDSVEAFEKATGVDAKSAMGMVQFQNYLDAMTKVAGNNAKVIFMPSGPSASRDLAAQLTEALIAGGEAGKDGPAPVRAMREGSPAEDDQTAQGDDSQPAAEKPATDGSNKAN